MTPLAASAAPAPAGIDVLGFPPDAAALAIMRSAELQRCAETERPGRLALFVSVGLFLAWVADVAAALQPVAGASVLFGLASLPLACAIVAMHLIGRRLLDRAQAARSRVEHRYAEVKVGQAQELLQWAASNAVVAQYLRMVGRQQRALRGLELAALSEWVRSPT